MFIYALAFVVSIHTYQSKIASPIVTDVGRLLPVAVKEIQTVNDLHRLKETVKNSSKTGDKMSIAGMQHSQGGHTYYPNAILLDMKGYNKILDFDKEKKQITVQAGVTWNDIQHYINPYGLSIQIMQSQNIFTVGGSLSVNVHGRDIRYGSIMDSVVSFRLLKPNGEIVNVSRKENSELFPYVIGGYGLFGIIIDVTLRLTNDELYITKTDFMNYQEYPAYFQKTVKRNPNVKMHLARISIAPDTFLQEMYVTNYFLAEKQQDLPKYMKLKGETVAIPKVFLGISRLSDGGKNLFWDIQKQYMKKNDGKLESRNNVMRSDSLFMEYRSGTRTEILQEYFIPVEEFPRYIDELRSLLVEKHDVNLLNITIRYVGKDEQPVLSYSKDDMFALVLLINQGTKKHEIQYTEKVIQEMINITLDHGGSYYLPYFSYPTKEQFYQAYPRAEEFFLMKKMVDPNERFINLFYEEYGK